MIFRYSLFLISFLLLSACVSESPPSFRTTSYGAGFAFGPPGHRISVSNEAGEVVQKARFSQESVRLYDENMSRTGRVRITNDHHELLDRSGERVCEIDFREKEAVFLCDNRIGFSVLFDDERWIINLTNEAIILAQERNGWIATQADRVLIEQTSDEELVYEFENDPFSVSGRIRSEAAIIFLLPNLVEVDDWQLLRGAIAWSIDRLATEQS